MPPAPRPTKQLLDNEAGSELASAERIALFSLFGVLVRDRVYPPTLSPEAYAQCTGNPPFDDAQGDLLPTHFFIGPSSGDQVGSLMEWAGDYGADRFASFFIEETFAAATGQATLLYTST